MKIRNEQVLESKIIFSVWLWLVLNEFRIRNRLLPRWCFSTTLNVKLSEFSKNVFICWTSHSNFGCRYYLECYCAESCGTPFWSYLRIVLHQISLFIYQRWNICQHIISSYIYFHGGWFILPVQLKMSNGHRFVRPSVIIYKDHCKEMIYTKWNRRPCRFHSNPFATHAGANCSLAILIFIKSLAYFISYYVFTYIFVKNIFSIIFLFIYWRFQTDQNCICTFEICPFADFSPFVRQKCCPSFFAKSTDKYRVLFDIISISFRLAQCTS